MNSNSYTHIKQNIKPRLEVQMSWWTMTGLGFSGQDWSTEERIERIAQAGFDGINGFIPDPADANDWRLLLEANDLSFSVNAYPKSASDMERFLEDVQNYGHIQFINAQVLTPFLIDEPAEELICSIIDLSRSAGIPVFIETHRGTITQDLIRTVRMVEKLKELRMTIDFSHYILAGEMLTISDEAELYFQKLLSRTSSIHARVSNGEQIQVDLDDEALQPMMENYKRWWSAGMGNWLNTADANDVFPFVCELGPPPYAMTRKGLEGRASEVSDRWSQSLLFAQIARELWGDLIKVKK